MRETSEVVYASSYARRKSERARRISSAVKRVEDDIVEKPKTKLDPNLTRERVVSEPLENDRGRLYVNIEGMSGVPVPSGGSTKYGIILSNGRHEIATPVNRPFNSSGNVEIGQEFELIVGRQLVFELKVVLKNTVQMPPKIMEVKVPVNVPSSPISPQRQQRGFTRLFGSNRRPPTPLPPTPTQTTRIVKKEVPQPPKEQTFVYTTNVDLSDVEPEIYGAAERYEFILNQNGGTLNVQMLYIPRGTQNEDLPHTMYRALQMIQEGIDQKSIPSPLTSFTGYMSQLGGDCSYWRRRFFRVDGIKLMAYSDSSHKPRAYINLGKATKVIDNKDLRTRKSVIAEEAFSLPDDKDGFRIKFANGESIDFQAENGEKDKWVEVVRNVLPVTGGKSRMQKALETEKIEIPQWVEKVLERIRE